MHKLRRRQLKGCRKGYKEYYDCYLSLCYQSRYHIPNYQFVCALFAPVRIESLHGYRHCEEVLGPTKQSSLYSLFTFLDCRVAYAPRNDD